MLILGRSPNLVLGAATALFNVVVVLQVGGFNPTAEQISAVNVLLAALVALIANSDTISAAAGKAAVSRQSGNGGPTNG